MKILPMRSVFFKLMTAYLTAFLIILTGASFVSIFSASSRNMDISTGNLRYYASVLTDRIGVPPSFAEAGRISSDSGIQITIDGNGQKWSSSEDLTDHEEGILQDDLWSFIPGVDEPMIEVSRSGYTFYYSEFHADHQITFVIWIIMSFTVLVALTISYLMVHHHLKPLREMHEITQSFGLSEWNRRVSPKGSDELASLGRAMNAMADRIEEYIHSMHDLLAAVSHELRSPLTRMKVALEFIDDENAKDSLNEEIDILDRLTGNLLEQRRLSLQQGFLNYEKVSLHPWVDEVCRPYQNKGCPLTLNCKGPELEYLLDRSRMDMVLRNLIENSLRHAPGAEIRILLDTTAFSGFTLTASDSGPGISDVLLKRLGEPFLLGDTSRAGIRSGGGFGLGLSIVKAVVAAHGADLTITNPGTGGLDVRMKFP